MNTGALARMECGSEVRQCNAFLGTVEQTESRPCCALLSVAAPGFRTSECRCEMRPFVPRSGGEKWSSGLPVECVVRKPASCFLQASLSSSIPRRLGHCFRAFTTPCGASPFCFPDSSPRASLGPCSRMHGSALGSRAHSHSFARCDPSRSGIQNQETRTCL